MKLNEPVILAVVGRWIRPWISIRWRDQPLTPPQSSKEDWGATVEWNLLLEEDLAAGPVPVPESVAAAAAVGPSRQGPHQEWLVVPYVPPPPPELELLPGGVPATEFVEQIMAWAAQGLPYRDVIQAAKNRWEIRVEEQFPLLHLAVLLVLGTRRLVAQGLMEAALLRLQQDPSGSTVLQGFLEDLLQILR